MEEILVVTVVAELPSDLGIENVGVFSFEDAPPWEGWDAPSMANLIHFLRPLEQNRRPEFRIMFRRARVRTRLPLQAADKAYSDWVDPLLQRRRRMYRRIAYTVLAAIGMREFITVAAITAFLPAHEVAEDLGPSWIEQRTTLALAVLNEFLICLGVEANDPRVGPIYRTDLPARLPVLTEIQPVPTAWRVGHNTMTTLHDWFPAVRPRQRDPEHLDRAAALFRATHEGETPWFAVLELTHTARRDGMAGRYASAVLTAGTGIEVLVATIITHAGRLRGWPPARIDGILGSGLKNMVLDHVPRALDVRVDIDDPETPWGTWWLAGYQLRNAVAHRNHRPTESEAQSAVYAAMELVAEVGRVIDADPVLSELSLGLPTGVARP